MRTNPSDNARAVCATHGTECAECRNDPLAQGITETVVPSIHFNGSGVKNLTSQYKEAIEAVSNAINALPAPHARDYYVQEAGALEVARKQFSEQILKLEGVRNELKTIYFGIKAQERAAS